MAYEIQLPPRPHRGKLKEEEEAAYIEQMTDEQREHYFEVKKQREATRVSNRPGRRSSQGMEADITISELQTILRYIFEGIGSLVRSDAEWSDEEFNTISRGLLVIINRFNPLKVVVRLLTPISSIAQLVRKGRKLMDGRRNQDNTT